jgi:uncharacterized protein (DUF4415 family)
MKKVKTSISIDEDIFDKIKATGEVEDRSFSQQLNKILKDYLKEKE